MRFYKLLSFFFILLCLNRVQFAYAQTITPKPGPIVLHLDANGKYTVALSDVATVTGITDPSTQVSISPAGFDCTTLGAQSVTVTATNGTFTTPTTPSASSFGGPWNITIDGAGNFYFSDFGNNKIKKITPFGGVTTLAGSGDKACNDGFGTTASFSYPIGVVTDKAGNVYVADALCHVIKKISPLGNVTTLAGTGSPGYHDDIGKLAAFNTPLGLAIDAAGNIYVADSGNERIRRITPLGVVTTFAGDGTLGSTDGLNTSASFYDPSGLVFDALGNLYVSDAGSSLIRKISVSGVVITIAGTGSFGSADGIGTLASFYGPYGLAMDKAGNLYVADRFNNEIRQITPAGVVSTFAGNTAIGSAGGADDGTGKAASFSDPTGLVFDAAGNLYVADKYNHKIRKISPGAVVTTFAGDGNTGDVNGNIGGAPATGTQTSKTIPVTVVSTPVFGVYNDVSTNVDVSCNSALPDYTQKASVTDACAAATLTVTQVPAAGTILPFNKPTKVTLTADDGFGGKASTSFNVTFTSKPVITPKAGPLILLIDATGKAVVNLADVAKVTSCVNPSPNVLISPASFDCTQQGSQVVTVSANDGSFAPVTDANTATFNHPFAMASDQAGNIYVTDQLGNTIRKITPQGIVTTFAGNGRPISADGTGTLAGFNAPSGIVADAAGNLYVTDYNSGLIRKITPAGVVTTIAGNGGFTETDGIGTAASFLSPAGITIDSQGNLYVADQGSSRIRKIATDGLVTTIAGNNAGYADGKGAAGLFNGPAGITIDAVGNLYVADDYNRRIRKITPLGDVTTLAGSSAAGSADGTGTSASFAGVVGIAIDNNGNLYVTESGTVSKIRKITPQGVVSTYAGTGVSGYLDDYTAKAKFNNPTGVMLDAAGNLFVADDGNTRLRKVTPLGVVSTFAGTSIAVDKDGNTAGAPTGNITQLQIPVTVEDNATIVDKLAGNQTVIAGDCIALLPDYTPQVTATDNCTGANIPFVQSPLPGTPLTIGTPVRVSISSTNVLIHNLSVAFFVTATGVTKAPAVVTITSSADSVCKGTPVTFTAAVANPGSILSYQWLINGANAGSTSTTFTTDALNDKDVVNCAVISGAGCTIPTLGNAFTIKVNPVPLIKFDQKLVVLIGSSLTLEPLITNGNVATYSWSPVTGLDDPTKRNPVATPTVETTYQLHVVSTGGCDAVASATVTVVKPIIIPNAFTPNGDGINDVWNVAYLNGYAGCTVDVFNRYGQLVFHSIGYGKSWDGSSNNGVVPEGVYYYVIDLKDGSKKYSGQLTILK
jgi:gliding motility-associated-like protein